MRKIFLDTSGILALVNKRDSLHKIAIQTNRVLLLDEVQFIITDYILVEVGNALCKNKSVAIKTLNFLRASDDVLLIRINEKVFEKALEQYEQFNDKEWGITDITSFIVMKEHNITEAFTHDHHFEQYGFRVLL